MSAATGLTALVLAGSRGPHEPLAVYAGVSHKALIEVDGQTMVERVVNALAKLPQVTRIVVMIETPALLDSLPALRALGERVLSAPAAGSPSLSVAAALEQFGTPLLVTTADHALLQPEWLQYFLDHCPDHRDVCVALARREQVLAAVPDTQRTWLRFADGHFSGCNMFYLATPRAAGVVQFWRGLESDRKHPWRMLRRVGLGSALRYLFGKLSLREAVQRIGARSGAMAAIVELPFGRAAVDVDKPSDLDLVRRLIDAS